MPDEERGPDEAGWAAPPPPPPPSPASAPPPPPAAFAPPQRPPRRRRAWLVVLIALLGVVLLSAVVGTVLFVSNTLPPYDAANDFVNDLADGRFRAAAAQLCSADQRDSDSALSVVTRHFPGNDRISVNPFGVDRDGDRATVDYTVSRERGSDSVDTFELPLRHEDGDWKPCPGDGVRLR